jgi:hypothetical protein
MWPRKKKFIFFFHGESARGHQPPNLHLGTLMDIGGLAQRTESAIFIYIFIILLCFYVCSVPRSVDKIELTIEKNIEYKNKNNEKR